MDEISAADLFERTRHRLRITVDDPQKALRILDMADVRVEGDILTLLSGFESPALLNRKLVEGGVAVSGLTVLSDGLEQYFVERIGGEQ